MLAKGLDYDEIESFQQHCMAGSKPNKFKWSSIDKAGTISIGGSFGSAAQALASTISRIASMQKADGTMGEGIRPGGLDVAMSIARNQGRDVAYICPDGLTRDKAGLPLVRTPDHIPYSFRSMEEFDKWQSDLPTQQK